MSSTPSVIRRLSNANNKGYVIKILNEEVDTGGTRHNKAILD